MHNSDVLFIEGDYIAFSMELEFINTAQKKKTHNILHRPLLRIVFSQSPADFVTAKETIEKNHYMITKT